MGKQIGDFTVAPAVTADSNFLGVEIAGGSKTDYLYTADQIATYVGSISGVTHLIGLGGAPTILPGAGAGAGGTATIAGDDLGGVIEVTTGVGASANTLLCEVTFDTPYAAIPKVVLITPATEVTNALASGQHCYAPNVTITTTVFSIYTGGTPLAAPETYRWYYFVKQ